MVLLLGLTSCAENNIPTEYITHTAYCPTALLEPDREILIEHEASKVTFPRLYAYDDVLLFRENQARERGCK